MAGVIPIKRKKNLEEPIEPVSLITPATPCLPILPTIDNPKWGKVQWKKMGDPAEPGQTPLEAEVRPQADVADMRKGLAVAVRGASSASGH
jgi:hypothetical protein